MWYLIRHNWVAAPPGDWKVYLLFSFHLSILVYYFFHGVIQWQLSGEEKERRKSAINCRKVSSDTYQNNLWKSFRLISDFLFFFCIQKNGFKFCHLLCWYLYFFCIFDHFKKCRSNLRQNFKSFFIILKIHPKISNFLWSYYMQLPKIFFQRNVRISSPKLSSIRRSRQKNLSKWHPSTLL